MVAQLKPPERKELRMNRATGLVTAIVLTGAVLGWIPWPPTRVAWAQPCADHPLLGVEKKTLTVESFRLESGQVLPQVTLAYETYGQLAGDGRNAILIMHGYTSNHHAAGCYAPTDPAPGWWDKLIGLGKAIDTRRV